ncbi:MAG: response regulator [Ferruginibacter sp.]|jgi:CRP/FNR family cyclic AMP-dependent transcriptional regulator
MKQILLIEDNTAVRENTAELLELANYKMLVAANGKVGVELALKYKPDLIICDIMMPELDGYGVLHLLGRNKETSSIPFIFLTAKTEKTELRKGMEMGADDFITKPFDDVELLKVIEIRLEKAETLKTHFSQDITDVNDLIQNVAASADIKLTSDEREMSMFKKKQLVYAEGKRPLAVYNIINGKIKTFKVNEFGKELITGVYTGGDFIGYTTVLEETIYADTAEVLEDAELMIIPTADFLQLIYNNPQVSKQFIKLLTKNVLENEEKLLTIAYQSLRKKVAIGLIEIFDKFKTKICPSPELVISRQDLSHIVGVATESLVRTLSDFKADKLIELKEGKIIILEEILLRGLQY